MPQPTISASPLATTEQSPTPTGRWTPNSWQSVAEPTDLTAFEVRQSVHTELAAVADSLIAEHHGLVPAGTVIRHVAQAREQLLRAGVRAGLTIAVESMARARLRDMGHYPHAT